MIQAMINMYKKVSKMYDNICKFLAETFPDDVATWLLGRSVQLSQLSPKELSN